MSPSSHVDLKRLIYLAVLRDAEERGRDIEGCIKQWFAFVKPNFERYVEPQRKVAGRLIHCNVNTPDTLIDG
jgi:uridine kinase